MINVLRDYIIYRYNDSVTVLLTNYQRYSGRGDGLKDTSYAVFDNAKIDFFVNRGVTFLSGFVHPILLNNILVIFFTFLTVFVSYKLFLKLVGDRVWSFSFALINAFSIYYIFRVSSATYALMATFLFPLALILLLSKRNVFLLSGFTFLSFLISTYYGFFISILVCLWMLFDALFSAKRLESAKKLFAYIFSLIFLTVLFYGGFALSNLGFSPSYKSQQISTINRETPVIYRGIQDWYSFSFRPWYFFIPPMSSVFFGELSHNLHEKLSSTQYYLALNYAEDEMAGSYLGWHLILGMAVSLFAVFMKQVRKAPIAFFGEINKNSSLILRCTFILLGILFLSMPPSFTVHGIEIFTPSFLFYKIFAPFRVLTRWSVVTFLLVLVINSYLFLDIYKNISSRYVKGLFISAFILLNFVMFAVRLPIISLKNDVPEEFSLVSKGGAKLAMYPKVGYKQTFWATVTLNSLVNPPDLFDYKTDFDSNSFTKGLNTDSGIADLRKMDVDYLYYYVKDTEVALDEALFTSNFGAPIRFSGVLIYEVRQ